MALLLKLRLVLQGYTQLLIVKCGIMKLESKNSLAKKIALSEIKKKVMASAKT
jgi:hypothetical protein